MLLSPPVTHPGMRNGRRSECSLAMLNGEITIYAPLYGQCKDYGRQRGARNDRSSLGIPRHCQEAMQTRR